MTADIMQTPRSAPLQGAYGNYALSKIKSGEAKHSFTPAQMQKIDEAAKDFEAVFISQMLEHMFDGVETNEVFGGGEAEDVYRSMLIDEYGKTMSKTGGIGLADHVKRQLLTLQETE